MKLARLLLFLVPLFATGFEYRQALPGYQYQFPRDHFEHGDFRTEWWYYTGNVTSTNGERFGFELVFFREGERGDAKNGAGAVKSAWAVQDLYLAHAALTDVRGHKFWYEERLNRAGPGIAGASFDRQRIWNGNWSTQWHGDKRGNGEKQTLDAVTEHFRFHLELTPDKPFVIQGENGLSQKAEGAGRVSYYVSFPRLRVAGTVNSLNVSGTAWMDHEWFSEQLAPNQVGWDWFSVQLDNNTELMLFDLRRKDGSIDPYSSGTYIDAEGKAKHLRNAEFTLQPVAYWHKYPIEWRIRVPELNLDLKCHAVMPDQELRGKEGGTSYWEGAVDYSGTQLSSDMHRDSGMHRGVGYLEMTGYEGPVRF